MILIIISSLLLIMSLLVNHLFCSIALQNRLGISRIHEIQQFEAAEASLCYGENLLTRQLLEEKTRIELPYVTAFEYCDYKAHISIIKLPQAFCILPHKKIGHYYQLTTRVTPKGDAILYGNELSLRSNIALPSGSSCTTKKLPQRPMGRSSWCQLN